MAPEKTILISGCPRSGTSWVHFLLSSHPKVITARETHLYDKYVGPLKKWFDNEEQFESADGLSRVFTETEFVERILGSLVHNTFDKICQTKQADQVLVEKTPGNVLHHRLIRELQPNCKLLFVVRDPRAVFASFKAGSSHSWGGWMKKSIAEFCVSWNKYITAYLAAKSYWPASQIKSVKFEDIKTDGTKMLGDLYAWMDLDFDENELNSVLSKNQIVSFKNADQGALQFETRKDFYRTGKIYGWVEELSFQEIREIEMNCLDLMSLFGYAIYKVKGN